MKWIATFLVLITTLAFASSCAKEDVIPASNSSSSFVTVEDGIFLLNDEEYRFVGTNFWYGAYIGQPGEKGNRDRLTTELDILVEHGITNLRILGASEESSFENSLKPAMLRKDGSVNEDLLVGLDFLLDEMAKRNMKAVIFLNNYWEWSGGMSTYNAWYGDGPAVDPADGDWEAFMKYSARFYKNEAAQDRFKAHIKMLIERVNTVNQTIYKNDTAIMAWQLANEPRPGRGESSLVDVPVYIDWIDKTAGFIKSLDTNHLVSSGSEGEAGSLNSLAIFEEAHATPNIDYLTFHMWAKNWGWIDTADMEGTYTSTLEKLDAYLDSHVALAQKMQKPIVLEEFGFPRDGENYELDSPTVFRDKYYAYLFDRVENLDGFSGTNFWSWGGLGRSANADYRWLPGDPFTGDPPQEPQGLNSIFTTDTSTLELIKAHAQELEK